MSLFGTTRSPRHIVFGAGQRRSLPLYARALGTRALICTDERLGGSHEVKALVDALTVAGVSSTVFDRSLPEVPVAAILECVAAGKAFGPDLIIGFGGGSCLDMAKVTAVLLAHGGAPQDYYGEYKVPGPVLPLIALPTTAGTGSEVTPVAVLADPDKALKVGISSPELIPTVAICDPELTYGAPRTLTAHSGADALTHAIESFTALRREVTPDLTRTAVFVGKNVLSDAHATHAIGLIAANLEKVVEDGADLVARENMMLGAMLAGLAFGSAGNAAAHALQYPVGALTHTSHGVGVACLMPYVMAFNRPSCTAAMASIADAMLLPHEGGGVDERAEQAIDAVAGIFARIGIPATLGELGLPRDKIAWTAEQSMTAARLVKNNPRPLDVAGMTTILNAAYDGDRQSLRTAN